MGKSRLFYEFTHSHRTHGWLILESGSVSYGKATTYLPVIDLLKAYFQIETRDDARKIREKVTGKLLTLDRALEPMLPAFLSLLDVPVEDPHWQDLDPGQRRQRTLEAVKRLLLRESQVQPLCVVFEDLHWIDSETQVVLDSLIESLPSARLLLLVNYRPEYQHGWGSKTYYTQLRIDPLPPESAEELLQGLVGRGAELQPFRQLLIERTEGNPFFLEESVRTLVETQVLVGERGAYRLAKPVQTIQVPATVQAVLAARIDRLSPEDKQLLQSASVIGEDVPFTLLQAIVEMPAEEFGRALSRLQTVEFLYETNLFPDLEYTFKHALTHQVAYNSLLHERRRALHARIVEGIERIHTDRVAEHAERLAHHALRGEVWEKAVSYLRQAGAKALARSAHRESVASFEQALAALQHLPQTPERLEQAIDLRFDLRTSLVALGELERVFGYLREAERLARTLDDPRRLGWVSVYMSHYFWVMGHPTEARPFAERAQAIAEALGDFPLKLGATFYLGTACLGSGDYLRAEGFLRETLQFLTGDLSRERFGLTGFPAVMARAYLSSSLADRGEFDEAIAQGQEGVWIAEAVNHPYSLILALRVLAHLHGTKGEVNHAVRLFERGLAIVREWSLLLLTPSTTGYLGYLYALSGRVEEGLSLMEQAITAIESSGVGLHHSSLVARLAEAYMLADRLNEASALAERALMLARERGQRGDEAHALHLSGEVASRPDHAEAKRAEEH
ncbi:MAG: AAA family ATPase, partial [Candidatus Methylomirabilia bacterium]